MCEVSLRTLLFGHAKKGNVEAKRTVEPDLKWLAVGPGGEKVGTH